MTAGGYRPGAGRKRGPASIEREKVKDYIAERIAADIEPMVTKMIAKVKKGDVFAFKELLDRGFGRPHQSTDITTNGMPIPLFNYINVIRDNNSNQESPRLEEKN